MDVLTPPNNVTEFALLGLTQNSKLQKIIFVLFLVALSCFKRAFSRCGVKATLWLRWVTFISEFLKLLSICMPLQKQWYFQPKIPLLLVLWSKSASFIIFSLLCEASFLTQGLFYPTPSAHLGAVDQPQNSCVAHTLCPLLVHLEQSVAFLFLQALWSPWRQGSCFINVFLEVTFIDTQEMFNRCCWMNKVCVYLNV